MPEKIERVPRKRLRRPARTEKRVWQEAGSRCVFCPESDVSALHVHHVDGDRTNNAFENLILVCATCHSKITAGVISASEVIAKKIELKSLPRNSGATHPNEAQIRA